MEVLRVKTALIIIQIIITLALSISVILQSGKTQGLPGSIAGGAESFFGKNKGRTMDGILNKITLILAVLFIISSVVLYVVLAK
jgi:preprotein translocase subunit SecG